MAKGDGMLFAIDELARHWWVIALRALATALFGISGTGLD
jgi:hypothetical protein